MVAFGATAAALTDARIRRWLPVIKREAALIGVRPSVVAAIISRETAGFDAYCLPPKQGGRLGDGGHGCGPMQVDDRSWPYWCAQWKASQVGTGDGIHMGCRVLDGKMKAVARLLPTLQGDERVRAAVASYNCGEGRVKQALALGMNIDNFTTGGNYSSDVFERAQYFAEHGFDS